MNVYIVAVVGIKTTINRRRLLTADIDGEAILIEAFGSGPLRSTSPLV